MNDGVSTVLRKMQASTSPKSTAKSSETPEITNKGALVDRLVHLKRELAALTEQYNETESDVIESARTEYERCRKSGEYQSTVHCVGKTTEGVAVIFADKFSPLSVEFEKDLRHMDPKFDDHFCEAREVKLKDTSDAVIKQLVEALGASEFERLFDASVKIVARRGLAAIFDSLTAKVRNLLKQAKPSVRELKTDGKV